MFNAQEGVYEDSLRNKHVSEGRVGSVMGGKTELDEFQSIGNELAISNMLMALNNPALVEVLQKMGIFEDTLMGVATHIKENVKNLKIHNSIIEEADAKGHVSR